MKYASVKPTTISDVYATMFHKQGDICGHVYMLRHPTFFTMHIHNIQALLIHDASFIRLEFVRKNNHASPPRANKALVLAKMTASQATART